MAKSEKYAHLFDKCQIFLADEQPIVKPYCLRMKQTADWDGVPFLYIPGGTVRPHTSGRRELQQSLPGHDRD